MSGNPLPWIALATAVVAALALKGYFRFPSGRQAAPNPAQGSNVAAPRVSNTTHGGASPDEAYILERLGSDTLGVYFALATRREAEAEVAERIARDAGDTIKAAFVAPFSPPEPAGQKDPAGAANQAP